VSVRTTDYAKDRMALEVISKAVPVEMMGPIASKPTAKAAWESIKLLNVGVDRVRKVKVSTLKHELDSLMFLDGESIVEFGARLGRITNQSAVLGFEYKEEEIVRRFLQALPPKFEQIATSIETLLDLETMSVDELIGHLKPTEERLNLSNSKAITSLNLTEDELVARLSSRLKISGNGGSDCSKEASSSGGKRGHGRGRGCGSNIGGCTSNHSGGDLGDHDGSTGHGNAAGSSDVAKDECQYCSKCGHWARECRKEKRDEEAHAAQVDEEGESTLLLASATVNELNSIPERTPVHLDE
jgi:hypothetical protein